MLVAVIVLLLRQVSANWMYLGVVGVTPTPGPAQPSAGEVQADSPLTEARALCSSLPGLVQQQVAECVDKPGAIHSVSDGARRGIQECQYQFRNERWNCTTKNDEQSVFGNILKRGSKETAFIYAVTSAGVVHAVTQSCSSGNLTECSCDSSRQGQHTPEGWKWGGCSDNLQFGLNFARRFVDAAEKVKPPTTKNKRAWSIRTKMNLHNNEAGRQIVASLMRMQCRCHGVSGSCELKTCWKTMPSFSEIGDALKRKYHQAVQVATKTRKRLRRKSKTKQGLPVSKGDLVHIHKSPNYCVHNPAEDIPGTSGRICNKTSHGPDSCDLLCCGRGYNTQVIKHAERCQCKFVWCCYVKCKTCETQVDRHTCK
ncbi:protein Wnt-16-like isoform X2 [Schistocerca americana]|uniref:protein Wnt-16-like isoform X2 n=1 Tax=Schistocerca americana TaxID=7009 RepID=UPI001F4FD926|nr:protein Wnt-16-like isoform X2 [Schistocerca americana]XP_047103607.1 protein Wnt-16-like isoform X2 [Schistocerca piceifrons]XP_049781513.1 protein Wnt-16-like isoform X2 [Schistocerca cancellata]XP_049807345.1 protein Wnt-16-like isoform X2 [Schistocerca nitens]XP_049846629.1 protein Wnt-16-like isoform X2 [Schistocerca gregaria]XP_049955800.1 protein Wnt-16-like isoform X2 [Schistocerca serialis cubense]